jgi:hypothetical protein
MGDSLALGKQLFGGAPIADDLYSFREAFHYEVVALAIHGASPCPL